MRTALLLMSLLTMTAPAENLPATADAPPVQKFLRGIRLGEFRFDQPVAEVPAATNALRGTLPGAATPAAGALLGATGQTWKLGRYADLSWSTSRFATAPQAASVAAVAPRYWASGFKLEFHF